MQPKIRRVSLYSAQSLFWVFLDDEAYSGRSGFVWVWLKIKGAVEQVGWGAGKRLLRRAGSGHAKLGGSCVLSHKGLALVAFFIFCTCWRFDRHFAEKVGFLCNSSSP